MARPPSARAYVQRTTRDGYDCVVDMDPGSFFDRVNHDRLMARLPGRTTDATVLRAINAHLEQATARHLQG